MLLCDLEQTFALPLKRLTTTRHRPTVLALWALRGALLYAWFAASWWQLKYLNDTVETRLVVGSFSALALLAVSPPLQAVFRSRPFHFLGPCFVCPELRLHACIHIHTHRAYACSHLPPHNQHQKPPPYTQATSPFRSTSGT